MRHAYGAKSTVEGCRSIDVLRWSRLGYLSGRSAFSWQWVSDEENVATIGVVSSRDGVTLKYKSRSYGEDWSDVEHHEPISGPRVASAARGRGSPARPTNPGSTAGAMLSSYTSEASYLRAVIATASLMPANKKPPTNAASTALKRFVRAWAGASACLKISRTSPKECIGGLMIGCGDATIWPRHDPWLD